MYQFDKPTIKNGIVFLKVISQPTWMSDSKDSAAMSLNGNIVNYLKVGDITWETISRWEDGRNHICPEGNRHCANINKKCFEVINPPIKYQKFVHEKYRNNKKYAKKKLII